MFINKIVYVTEYTVKKYEISTAEPAYNDIGLCLISSITSHTLWY